MGISNFVHRNSIRRFSAHSKPRVNRTKAGGIPTGLILNGLRCRRAHFSMLRLYCRFQFPIYTGNCAEMLVILLYICYIVRLLHTAFPVALLSQFCRIVRGGNPASLFWVYGVFVVLISAAANPKMTALSMLKNELAAPSFGESSILRYPKFGRPNFELTSYLRAARPLKVQESDAKENIIGAGVTSRVFHYLAKILANCNTL